MSERMVSGVYHRANGDSRRSDPATVRRLAREFWQSAGGAMLTPEELECLSDRAKREVIAVMTQRHGKRGRG